MMGVSLEYLRGLGIDVWMHKQTVGRIEEIGAAPLGEEPEIQPSDDQATSLSASSAVGPHFTIRGFRLERVFALVSEEALPDMSLIRDIAWAINGRTNLTSFGPRSKALKHLGMTPFVRLTRSVRFGFALRTSF